MSLGQRNASSPAQHSGPLSRSPLCCSLVATGSTKSLFFLHAKCFPARGAQQKKNCEKLSAQKYIGPSIGFYSIVSYTRRKESQFFSSGQRGAARRACSCPRPHWGEKGGSPPEPRARLEAFRARRRARDGFGRQRDGLPGDANPGIRG